MSLMSMRRKMASKRTVSFIVWGLIVVFVGAIVIPQLLKDRNSTVGNDPSVIATVNGKKIRADAFYTQYAGDQKTGFRPHDLSTALPARQQAFESMVQEIVQEQAIKNMGVRTWSWTLRAFAKELVEYQLNGVREYAKQEAESLAKQAENAKEDEKKEVKTADQLFQESLSKIATDVGVKDKNPTEEAVKRGFVRKVTGRDMREQLITYAQMHLLGEKVIKGLPGPSPLSEGYVQKMMTKDVKASWIFIAAHDNTPKALEDAKLKAEEVLKEVSATPASFAAKAKTASSDFMTAQEGGSLGWIQAYEANSNYLAPRLAEYLAYTLEKNTISPIMLITHQTPMSQQPQVGYALVKVDDIRDRADLKDYNWDADKRAALLKAKFHYSQAFGQNQLSLERAKADIVRLTDELKYYEAQANNDKAAMDALLPGLVSAKNLPSEVVAAFKYAQLQETKDPKQRVELLDAIISYAPQGQQTRFMLDLARAYAEAGQKEIAIDQLLNVAAAVENSDPDTTIHTMLKDEFKKLGDMKNAQKMAAWLKANPKPETPDGGGMPMMSLPPQ